MPNPSNGAGQVIPFGKYRGQPLEVLEKDPEYLNWLTNQDWFRTGHANLYQIVINNFAEPCDTPEHNQMQARFLDEQFRLKFANLVINRKLRVISTYLPEFETDGIDVRFVVGCRTPPECDPCPICKGVEFWKSSHDSPLNCSTCTKLIKCWACDGTGKRIGVDCYACKGTGTTNRSPGYGEIIRRADGQEYDVKLKIEIKPSVGDDFPSVMRQMKRSKSEILFVRNYSGTGIDENTFVEMFHSQKIPVVFEREIDNSGPNCPVSVPSI